MIRNVWSVLCRNILTDQETNAVTYIQCIEEGAASVLPTLISPITIGTLWEKDSDSEERFTARIVFILPSGPAKPLLQTKELTFARPRQRLHFKLEGLQVTEFGRHEIRVEYKQEENWVIASRMPFMVRKLVQPPQ